MSFSKSVEEIQAASEGANFIFIHQDDNWADEMDVDGFRVCTREEFDEMLLKLQPIHFPITRWFGTNEESEYDSLNEYLYTWKVKPITSAEYYAFLSIFGTSVAGSFYLPDGCDEECIVCEEEADFLEDEDEDA